MASFVSAQTDSLYLSTEVENEIYCIDFKASKTKLLDFVKANHFRVLNQKDSRSDLSIKFVLNRQQYLSYDAIVTTLGNSTSKKINTVSDYNKINEINLELKYLKQKRDSYSDLIKKTEEKSENYLTLWNEQKLTEEKIFNKERDLVNLNNKESTFTVSLELKDETTSPDHTSVSFVNMPGVEFSYLNIESPKAGISAQNYQGYFLKYLFTKGKSFGSIGVYKNKDVGKTDTTAFSEMFILGFGQDFYSRYFGRGSKKFFNLYSGYTIGGVMATGKTTKENMFFISPSIGLELFKNKYLLIDSKANYFVPLGNNRNLRGLSYNLSFNFVF